MNRFSLNENIGLFYKAIYNIVSSAPGMQAIAEFFSQNFRQDSRQVYRLSRH
jgi:hypothetical protein